MNKTTSMLFAIIFMVIGNDWFGDGISGNPRTMEGKAKKVFLTICVIVGIITVIGIVLLLIYLAAEAHKNDTTVKDEWGAWLLNRSGLEQTGGKPVTGAQVSTASSSAAIAVYPGWIV